jgi:hypothetical protein
MSAAALTTIAAASSSRLLADVRALDNRRPEPRPPALIRLETAIGRELADRLVTALSSEPHR